MQVITAVVFHVGIDLRPCIGQMPNLFGRSLANVPEPNIKI